MRVIKSFVRTIVGTRPLEPCRLVADRIVRLSNVALINKDLGIDLLAGLSLMSSEVSDKESNPTSATQLNYVPTIFF